MLSWVLFASPVLFLTAMILWDVSDVRPLLKNRILLDPMVLLTGVLAIFTGVACIIAFLQWRVLEKTDNTYWAAQRPWLGIDSHIEFKQLTVTRTTDTGGINIQFNLPIKNYGNIPAIDTRLASTVLVAQILKGAASRYEILAADYKKITETRHVLCKSAENNEPSSEDFSVGVGDAPSVFPKEISNQSESAGAEIPAGAKHISGLFYAACINYKFGENNIRSGKTFFVIKFESETDEDIDVSIERKTTSLKSTLMDFRTRAD